MGVILAGIILFVLAFSIKELLSLKMEQSVFLAVCSIIILLFLFGTAGSVEVGYYFILALSAALFAAVLILLAISKKRRSAFSVKSVITPGTVAFFLASAVYFIFIRGEKMAVTDAAVHWGYASRWMYETGRIYVGVQTLSIPLFNYFLIKTAGYAESTFFLGRWMVMWAAIILPVSGIKWDKWYKALLYSVMAYMVLGVIDSVPKMLMDLPLGVAAGALCAWLAVSRGRPKDMLTAAIGVVVLGNVKNGSGLLFALFVFGFAAIMHITGSEKEKKGRYYLAGFVPALAVTELFRRLTHESNIKDNAEPGMVVPLELGEIADKLTSGTMILLYAATVAAAVIFIYLSIKKKRDGKGGAVLYKTVLAIMCILAALTLYKAFSGFFSSLGHNDQVTFIQFWEKYSTKGYYGRQMRNLFGVLFAFSIACGLLCVKKEHAKSLWAQTAYIALVVVFYAFAVIITYLHTFIESEAAGYSAFHRYIGSSVVFAVMWLAGYIAVSDGIWWEQKRQLIATAVLLAFLSRETPPIGSVFNYGLRGEAGVHMSAMPHAEVIKENTLPEDRIYFISQDYEIASYVSDWSANAWIRYEIAPRYLNWVFWSLGENFKDVDPSTLNIESGDFKDLLLSDGYDYVYLYKTDDIFWERYGAIFPSGAASSSSTLYKVVPETGCILEPMN